jgi:predicted XRE-type DNA-binding protein
MPHKHKADRAENADAVVASSGNVFADLGLPKSNELYVKAKLMQLIAVEIRRRKLTQAEAAEKVGLSQGDISNISRGKFDRFSQDRLIDVLRNLGTDVEINLTPHGSDRVGRLTVNARELA